MFTPMQRLLFALIVHHGKTMEGTVHNGYPRIQRHGLSGDMGPRELLRKINRYNLSRADEEAGHRA